MFIDERFQVQEMYIPLTTWSEADREAGCPTRLFFSFQTWKDIILPPELWDGMLNNEVRVTGDSGYNQEARAFRVAQLTIPFQLSHSWVYFLHYVCMMCPLIYRKFPAHLLSLWAAPTTIYWLYHLQIKLHTLPMNGALLYPQILLTLKQALFFFFTQTDLFRMLFACLNSHFLKIKQNTPALSPMEMRKIITILTSNLQLSSWALMSRFFIIFIRPRF